MQLLGEPGDAAEFGGGRRPCGTDVFDRQVEQALEPLLDEVPHVVGQQRTLDVDAAFGREPAEPDRCTPQTERVA